jgi:hypothetical protein
MKPDEKTKEWGYIHSVLKGTLVLGLRYASRTLNKIVSGEHSFKDDRVRKLYRLLNDTQDKQAMKGPKNYIKWLKNILCVVIDNDGYYKEEFFTFIKQASEKEIWKDNNGNI